MGSHIDAQKLVSSMTLFAHLARCSFTEKALGLVSEVKRHSRPRLDEAPGLGDGIR